MVDFLVDLQSSCGSDDRCWRIRVKLQDKRGIEIGLPLADRLPLAFVAAVLLVRLTLALMSGSKASSESSIVRYMLEGCLDEKRKTSSLFE